MTGAPRPSAADFAARAGLEITARFTDGNLSASLQRGMLGGKLRPLPQRDALLSYLGGASARHVVLTTEVPGCTAASPRAAR